MKFSQMIAEIMQFFFKFQDGGQYDNLFFFENGRYLLYGIRWMHIAFEITHKEH